MKEYDYINPPHYKDDGKEVWEQMIDKFGLDKFLAHCELCIFKYEKRLGKKPNEPIERDLEKINWYKNKILELTK